MNFDDKSACVITVNCMYCTRAKKHSCSKLAEGGRAEPGHFPTALIAISFK